MKRFIFITVLLMIVVIFIGCFATMTPEERKETYDLRSSVGNRQMVGEYSPEAQRAAHGIMSY